MISATYCYEITRMIYTKYSKLRPEFYIRIRNADVPVFIKRTERSTNNSTLDLYTSPESFSKLDKDNYYVDAKGKVYNREVFNLRKDIITVRIFEDPHYHKRDIMRKTKSTSILYFHDSVSESYPDQ